MQIAYAACPLCGGDFQTALKRHATKHPLWHPPLPEYLEWCVCNACEHVFTHHYWNAEGLSEVFRLSNDYQLAGGDIHPQRVKWSQPVDKAVRLLGGYAVMQASFPELSWLDVGFGNGALVMTAAEYGFRAMGVDARQEAVTRLQSLGYHAVCAQFDTCTEGRFTVISMCDVLEHLPYPRASLRKARAFLDPNGLLLISLPNMDSSHWRVMDAEDSNPYWAEIEHYHNFSLKSLTRLLREEGFALVDYGVSPRYIACMEVFASPMSLKENSP